MHKGIMGCCSINDYGENKIKKHELTIYNKVKDMVEHFKISQANGEPVFLFHEFNDELKLFIDEYTTSNEPCFKVRSENGNVHFYWKVDCNQNLQKIENIFGKMMFSVI